MLASHTYCYAVINLIMFIENSLCQLTTILNLTYNRIIFTESHECQNRAQCQLTEYKHIISPSQKTKLKKYSIIKKFISKSGISFFMKSFG